jgi:hypothetical protein
METYKTDHCSVRVINDGDRHRYGTKERITYKYVAEKMMEGYNDFVYAGPANAMGAFAVANGCVRAGARCTLFLCGTHLTPQAKGFPRKTVKINLVKNNLYITHEMAEDYVKSQSERFLVPFGINDPLYKSLLRTSIEEDMKIMSLTPKRMWLAVGSGTILSILLEIFPKTEFLAVQVGKSLKIETLHDDPTVAETYRRRIKTYWSPEKFSQPAKIKPPYSSLDNYDAKIWQFVLKEGQEGDFIWNVARDFK